MKHLKGCGFFFFFFAVGNLADPFYNSHLSGTTCLPGTVLRSGEKKMNKTQSCTGQKGGQDVPYLSTWHRHSSSYPGYKRWDLSLLLPVTPVYIPSANCVDSISDMSTSSKAPSIKPSKPSLALSWTVTIT